MNQNQLFLLSIGCLFILLSCLMANPLYLIITGLFFCILSVVLWKKNGAHQRERKSSR